MNPWTVAKTLGTGLTLLLGFTPGSLSVISPSRNWMIHRIEPIRQRVILACKSWVRERFAQHLDSKKAQPTIEEDPGTTAEGEGHERLE
jgi:hypothetical protein